VFRATPDRFDVVITDQTMPGITGFELSRKRLALRPDIPIFMITGHSDLVDEHKAKALGIREFFMKPLDMRSIAQAISRTV